MSAPHRLLPGSGQQPGPRRSGGVARDSSTGILDLASPYTARRIGEILVSIGALDDHDLSRALQLQANNSAPPLGDILLNEGMISRNSLATGLALQQGVWHVPVTPDALDPVLIDKLGADTCVRHGIVPWRCQEGRTIVATGRPDGFGALRPMLESALGPVQMAVTEEAAIRDAVTRACADRLVALAEARPAPEMSVRGWGTRTLSAAIAAPLALLLVLLALVPQTTLSVVLTLACVALAAMSGLKAAALLLHLRDRRGSHSPDLPDDQLPRISLLVPLLAEADITDHLIDHLTALDYPAERLDILLLTEAHDSDTADRLGHNALPHHARLITVPSGTVRTKPRALNYGLDFARGDIVGVYDAEDAPVPDQLRTIAATFATAPSDVVCLQGRLDFYNPRQNWLSRCFALDYAAWFRVVLPGLARMGFAIPLGGTTLFFRRPALEALGRWDAHNVTEDADLGIRLARAGWRTEMAATVTYEEANCHAMPWIRQRTRWLKGYALTWAVHMRNPARLWRELGAKRFLGFQTMFLGTVFLFLAAPLMWSLWVLPMGLGHPLTDGLSGSWRFGLVALFITSELVNIATSAVAVATPRDRWLIKWVPTLMLYFPLATIAGYRALADIARAPFYWDKTRHGLSQGKEPASPGEAP